MRRYSVKGADGWHAVERGHRPQEGEWNTPTQCGMFVVAPWDFATGLKFTDCSDCLRRRRAA